jgi:signal transduction histidine kinase
VAELMAIDTASLREASELIHGSAPAEEQLEAIMAISRAVAESGALTDTLDQIAKAAAGLVRAKAAAIILRASESDTGLAVAGAYGVTSGYADYLNRERPLEVGKGPSGTAAQSGHPFAVPDMQLEPLARPWRQSAEREGFRGMVSVPLKPREGRVIGVLNAYRAEPGPWAQGDIDLLQALADHAAIAIRTANLLDDSRRQIAGLSLLVRSLRAQGHEHSNRLHAIYGLLTLGEVEQARRLIGAVEDSYYSAYAHVTARIENPVVAGFLVAEAAIARHSGIQIRVDRRSRLTELPAKVTDLDAITLIGNLLHNAVEAVAAMPASRRRVAIRLSQSRQVTTVNVRDWGPGIDEDILKRVCESYYTTKEGHSGIGLSLVHSIVNRANGRITIERPPGGGTEISVQVPS